MNQELNAKINEEISGYRKSLLFYARKCDWDTFKVKAGRLFDYVESIEMSEIKRKFQKASKIVVAILFFMLLAILKINPDAYPQLARVNELLILSAVAICCFEVYFFYTFRMYIKGKTVYYQKRREKFVRNIESDFREMAVQLAA